MKYLFLLLFFGCNITEKIIDNNYKSPSDIMQYVSQNIKYMKNSDKNRDRYFWQTPEETLKEKSGICADYVTLTAKLIHDNFGIKCDMALINNRKHSVIYIPTVKKYYDCQTAAETINPKIDKIIDYDKMMIYANTHNILQCKLGASL